MDASRLAEELRQEQDHASQLERMRRNAETQVKELQVLYCHKLYKQWKYSLEMQSLVLLIYKCSTISLAGNIYEKETKSKETVTSIVLVFADPLGRSRSELDEGRQTTAAEDGTARARTGGRSWRRKSTSSGRNKGHEETRPTSEGSRMIVNLKSTHLGLCKKCPVVRWFQCSRCAHVAI